MSDQGAVPLGLAQQKVARPIDPEQLELMGKKAAALFRNKGNTLSQAVVETVKEARLAPEQIRRVCEFANTAAYLEAFEKAGEVRNVTFDGGPADPSVVFKDLNDGSHPAVHQTGDIDYKTPTGTYKTASAEGMLKHAFAVSSDGLEKVASVQADHQAHADPADDVNDLRIRLEATREDLMSKLSQSGVVYDDIAQDLCHSVRKELDQGSSIGDIYSAWSSCSPSDRLVKEAAVMVAEYLKNHGYSVDTVKLASSSRVPNPKHPVVEQFLAFTKVAHGHRVLTRAVRVVDEQLSQARSKLREMYT